MGSRTRIRNEYMKVCVGYISPEIMIKPLNGEIEKAAGV